MSERTFVSLFLAGCAAALSVRCAAAPTTPAWARPESTRAYLQGPLAERILVCWREGKVTVGEVRHEHDWFKSAYMREESTPIAFGAWLVHGADDAAFDFKAARLRADVVPVRGMTWTLGDLEVGLEACAPFARAPYAHLRLSLANNGLTNITHRFAMMVRTAKEKKLVFSAPDLYASYAPVVSQWRDAASTWSPDGTGAWRDERRFLTVSPGLVTAWDDSLGAVRFEVSVKPGEVSRVDWVLGEGEVEKPDYDAALARTRADWEGELARVSGLTPLVRRMTVEMLQCLSRPIGKDYVLPRQGGLQRWVWPGEHQHASMALDRLGYHEYVERAIDFCLDQYLQPNGEVGPFGNAWACNTACVLLMFSRHCLDSGNAAYWQRRRGDAAKAFEWIKAKRRESIGRTGCVGGLFPPMKATDAGGVFQAWGNTDIYNLEAMETYAAAMERFAPNEAKAVRAEANDYRAVMAGVVDRWRKAAEGQPYFRLPLDPNGTEDAALRQRNYFYSHPGRFAAMGFLSEEEMLRLRNWLLKENLADEGGLYMRHTSCICWDTGAMLPFGLSHNVWYTTASEFEWFCAWSRVGRTDLASEVFAADLKYAITAEGCVGERYCSADPWFFPWSPNSSGAGRIALMALGSEEPTNRVEACELPLEAATLTIVSPERMGRRINRVPRLGESGESAAPWKLQNGKWLYTPQFWKNAPSSGYPSIACPMAFMIVSDARRTFCATPGLTDAEPSDPVVEYDPATQRVSVWWVTREQGGRDRRLRGEVREVVGGWQEAVRQYGEQCRAKRPMVERPQYVVDAPSGLLVILKQQNGEIIWPYVEFDRLAAVCERLGIDYVGLFGWTKGGHDHLYPNYDPDPAMGGRSALVKGIELLRQRGIRTFLYANGQLQERGKTEYWQRHGRDAAQVRADGNRYGETWHKYLDAEPHHFDLGCLSDATWKRRMHGLAWQAHALGSDGILYDQLGVGGPRCCFADGHGHPRGAVVYSKERVDFLKGIADEMRLVDPDFIVLTEGFHDTIVDSCAAFHGWGDGVSLKAAMKFRSRGKEVSDWTPEVVRIAFPDLQCTMRVPTPILTRTAVNYGAFFGFKHELEVRYGPDRRYLENGVRPKAEDYGTIRQKPDLTVLLATDPNVAGDYLRRVAAFQRRHRDHLLRGSFMGSAGVNLVGETESVAATRWRAADGSDKILVWNAATEPRKVAVALDGKPLLATTAPLAADSLRIYAGNGTDEVADE